MPSATGEHASPGGRLTYSVDEAAELLGIGRTLMYKLLTAGEVDSLKIGKRRMVPRDAIDGYIKRSRGRQFPSPGQQSAGHPVG